MLVCVCVSMCICMHVCVRVCGVYVCVCVCLPMQTSPLNLGINSKPRTPKLLPFPSKATRLPIPASGGASGRSTITATEMGR